MEFKNKVRVVSKNRSLKQAQRYIKYLNEVYKRKQQNTTLLDILNKK
jgi:hypothetical protein